MTEPEDYPLPWTFETHELSEGFSSIIYDAYDHTVPGMTHLMEDHARLICAGVDSHAVLLAAAKEVIKAASLPVSLGKISWNPNDQAAVRMIGDRIRQLKAAISHAEDQAK